MPYLAQSSLLRCTYGPRPVLSWGERYGSRYLGEKALLAIGYELDTARFEDSLAQHGFTSKTGFAEYSGIPMRTFWRMSAGDADIKLSTLRLLLDALPHSKFEVLFVPTNRAPLVARVAE